MHFFPEEKNLGTLFFFFFGRGGVGGLEGSKIQSIMKRDLNKNFIFVEFSTCCYDYGVRLSLCMFESKGSLFLWAHALVI